MDNGDRARLNRVDPKSDMLPETVEGLKYYLLKLAQAGHPYRFRGTIAGCKVDLRGISTKLIYYDVSDRIYRAVSGRTESQFMEDIEQPFKELEQ